MKIHKKKARWINRRAFKLKLDNINLCKRPNLVNTFLLNFKLSVARNSFEIKAAHRCYWGIAASADPEPQRIEDRKPILNRL